MSHPGKHPNILFLFSDQHSAATLGCYGNDRIHTPNLDRLAVEGVRLNSAYTNSPICTPSRVSFLSGIYPHNHGYYGLMGKATERLPSVFSHLKKHGYSIGFIGKSHTPAGWLSPHCDIIRDAMGYERGITGEEAHLLEGLQGRSDNDYTCFLESLGLAHLREDKFLKEQYEKFGYENGQGVDAKMSSLSYEYSVEGWCEQETKIFINRCHAETKPFFCWMTLPKPHQVYAPTREFWEMYSDDNIELPPNADDGLEGRHMMCRIAQEYYQNNDEWRLYSPRDWDSTRRRILRGYYGCVSQIDYAFGGVIDHLEELGIRDETIIIYTTDHGEFAGEHGMVEKAPGIGFRCVTRIPFLWSYPRKLPTNVTRSSIVEAVDFFPTVCDLAGIDPPDWVNGTNTVPVLSDDTPVKKYAYTEHPLTKTIHDNRYKLTQYLPEMCDDEEFFELYDMEADPWELHNLNSSPEYAGIAERLMKQLYYWLVRTSRHRTISPVPHQAEGPARFTWDLAEDLYDEDGRLGRNYISQIIGAKAVKTSRTSAINYL